MKTGTINMDKAIVKYSFLNDVDDNWLQFYYTIVPTLAEQIDDQTNTIEEVEKELFRILEINANTAAFKRFFSSDLINHRDTLLEYKERQDTDFHFSLTEQPPITAVKLSLLGMCLNNITKKSRDGNSFYCDTTSNIQHIFVDHLIDANQDEDSAEQTKTIFELLKNELEKFNATIEDNVLRTWLYAPHVDADYPGIVTARKKLFDSINLTKNTHYIASTGIQGGSGDQFARVSMEAYAVTGLDETKIRYIQAPEHLSPTHIYGVTFERATAIEMGDTDFLFISGTASIDDHGEVVHPGDIVKQTERTLINISALLDAAGFVTNDLSSFMVYLRDPADYGFVKPLIDLYAKDLPTVYVKAPVCRPGWLIEIEATAGRLLR